MEERQKLANFLQFFKNMQKYQKYQKYAKTRKIQSHADHISCKYILKHSVNTGLNHVSRVCSH